MKKSVFDWYGFPLPIARRAEDISAAGFDGVMMWWGDEDGPVDEKPAVYRSHGLSVDNIHTPFDRINDIWLDTLAGDAQFELLRDCLYGCRRHNIPVAVVHVSAKANPPPFGEVGLDRFRRLANFAEQTGIDIALENLRRLDYLDYVYAGVNSPRLKFCYDSGHELCRTPGVDCLERYGARLAALHLHDNDGIDDQHLLPFEGKADWPAIMARLRQTGYSGPLGFEIDTNRRNLTSLYTSQSYLGACMEKAKILEGM